MTLLVGIDEAGYGPHLGSLVVASATLEIPAAPDAADPFQSPDLWPSLETCVARRPAWAGTRVVVCDSKVAYAGGNLATIERAVLGALAAAGARPGSLAELLDRLAVRPADGNGSADGPWHQPHALPLPCAAAPEAVAAAADLLGPGLAGRGVRVADVRAAVASADRLNRLMDGGRNKAGALFTLAADLLSEAVDRAGGGPIHITMDRHGGRRYYADLLSGVFPMAEVEIVEESPEASRYLLHCTGAGDPPHPFPLPPQQGGEGGRRPGEGAAPVALTVREKCESWSLPTALASMAAKYVRELGMRQFNAYFQKRVPGLKATAGYGLDARRFLDEVTAAQAAAGVPGSLIWRNR
jgi:hypothetical protein